VDFFAGHIKGTFGSTKNFFARGRGDDENDEEIPDTKGRN